MNCFDTLFYLMGSSPYATPDTKNYNKEILILGKIPFWLNDLKIIMHGYSFRQVTLQELTENSIVLITDKAIKAPSNVVILDASKGKKHLWSSIVQSRLVSWQQ